MELAPLDARAAVKYLKHYWELYFSDVRERYRKQFGVYPKGPDHETMENYTKGSFYTGALCAYMAMTEGGPHTSEELASRLAGLKVEMDEFEKWNDERMKVVKRR